nr:MAG TPA: hypothetical protein [Caudoviricetes sp.]
MIRCAILRCKQCGMKVEDTFDLKISQVEFDNLFKTNGEVISYFGLRTNESKILHRCDPKTIGLCEFIGWKKDVPTGSA